MALLPSPRTSDTNGTGHHGDGGMDLRTAVAEIPLLPTPAVNDMGAAYTPDEWDAWTAEMKAKHNNGNGHGKSLNVEAQRLLPTPAARDSHNAGDPDRTEDRMAERGQPLSEVAVNVLMPTPRATDGTKGGPNQRGSSGDLMLPSAVKLLPTPKTIDTTGIKTSPRAKELYSSKDSMGDIIEQQAWGEYEPAIRRWETVTRPAPEPTKLNSKGNPKLSDEFDEWLMGYAKGWITDVPGVTWNETLKACGNGVVPQQGTAALHYLRTLAGAA